MQIRVHDSFEALNPSAWNALAGEANPFLRHEFFVALERHGCVGSKLGWLPRPIAAYDNHGQLIGAVPLYIKTNSYGELVFDWAWADAYHRSGRQYYPKLVAAIPYTPATGKRLLIPEDRDDLAQALIRATIDYAQEYELSSIHWLFPHEADLKQLQQQGLMPRLGCQFHWQNQGYQDFDEYLTRFSAEKRKKIKRERRRVREAGIQIDVVHGDEASDTEWRIFHELYCSIFDRKFGIPTLSLGFFQEIARTLPRSVVLVLARRQGEIVAGAFNLRGRDTLYGRHWGCFEQFHSLHFETCYYAGLEYCIAHGLQRFEPGAQGEHKISRGFLPTPTWSAHWIANKRFREAISHFLEQETEAMVDYMSELSTHSPFRKSEG